MALYDEIGPTYVEGQKKFQDQREAWGVSFIRKHIRPLESRIILDLGCGAGLDMETFLTEGANYIHGIDNSGYMVGQARERLTALNLKRTSDRPRWHVSREDFSHFSLRDKEFFIPNSHDAAYSRFALHYEPNVDKVYQQVHNILKPNGVLAFAVPHPLHDFVTNDKGTYGVQKDITVPLYGGTVSVTYPTHTFTDWLSPTFNKLFELIEIEEFHENHVEQSGLPTGLCIAGKKR